MNLFERIFNLGKHDKTNENLGLTKIRLGRYSDNNKSLLKTKQWFKAEELFKEKKFDECIEIVFDYLRDEAEDNVRIIKNENTYQFEIYQGTKIVHGTITNEEITAKVTLAKMEKSSIPVMRRLLEMNFALFYSRYAMQDDTLCMLFDSPRDIASPSKLYYGLKELATKADKQDDLLVTDFTSLQSVDDSHVEKFSESETEIKYQYFAKWITDTLAIIGDLNQDSFSGGIGYLLLTLIYKIDFLITPEGKLLNELETINNLYWNNKDDKTSVERNQMLKESFVKLLAWPKEEVINYFYRAKSSFAITLPKPHADIADSIKTANENSLWYVENKYTIIAQAVMEYGLSYCQYSYSLPKPVSELFKIYMKLNHDSFFKELGFKNEFLIGNELQYSKIKNAIHQVIQADIDRYPKLKIDTEKLNFNSLLEFNPSFLNEIAVLNFENQ